MIKYYKYGNTGKLLINNEYIMLYTLEDIEVESIILPGYIKTSNLHINDINDCNTRDNCNIIINNNIEIEYPLVKDNRDNDNSINYYIFILYFILDYLNIKNKNIKIKVYSSFVDFKSFMESFVILLEKSEIIEENKIKIKHNKYKEVEIDNRVVYISS